MMQLVDSKIVAVLADSIATYNRLLSNQERSMHYTKNIRLRVRKSYPKKGRAPINKFSFRHT